MKSLGRAEHFFFLNSVIFNLKGWVSQILSLNLDCSVAHYFVTKVR